MQNSVQLEHERNIYLSFTLGPLGFVIVLNSIFNFAYYGRLGRGFWPYLLGLAVLLTVFYIYATFRFGHFLGFSNEEWTITVLLYICFFVGSFTYMLVKASKAKLPADPD